MDYRVGTTPDYLVDVQWRLDYYLKVYFFFEVNAVLRIYPHRTITWRGSVDRSISFILIPR